MTITEIIERIQRALSTKHTFPGYSADDIAQEIALLCLRDQHKWDPEKGTLEQFLYVHCRNRLHTLRRDQFSRNYSYCPLQGRYTGDNDAATRKLQVLTAISFESVNDLEQEPQAITSSDEDVVLDRLQAQEILRKLDEELPPAIRPLLLKLLHDEKLSNKQRTLLLEEIHKVLWPAPHESFSSADTSDDAKEGDEDA